MVTFLFVIAISALIPYVAVPAIQHEIESPPPVETSVLHNSDARDTAPASPVEAPLAARSGPAAATARGGLQHD
jgi:hypothetical protein